MIGTSVHVAAVIFGLFIDLQHVVNTFFGTGKCELPMLATCGIPLSMEPNNLVFRNQPSLSKSYLLYSLLLLCLAGLSLKDS